MHLSNGTELGHMTPRDTAPGEVVAINLRATQASFTGWTAHAEVGIGGEGSETGGEHQGGEEHGGNRESAANTAVVANIRERKKPSGISRSTPRRKHFGWAQGA